MVDILHDLTNDNFSRVYRPFFDYKGVTQAIMAKPELKTDYFDLKIIHFRSPRDFKMALRREDPSVITQSHTNTIWFNRYRKYGISPLFIHHGFVGEDYAEAISSKLDAWDSFKAILCATNRIEKFLKNKKINTPVYTNCLPQLDILYEKLKYKPSNKTVSVFLHRIGNGKHFGKNDKFLLNMLEVINDILGKSDYQINIKYKSTKKFKKFKETGELNKLLKRLSGNISFVSARSDTYEMIANSKFVISTARSSVEVESILANKPILLFDDLDIFNTDYFNVSNRVTSIENFSDILKDLVLEKNPIPFSERDAFIEDNKIIFDGNHTQRAIEILTKFRDKNKKNR